MQRLRIRPRQNWQAAVEKLGLQFHTPEGRPYWDESVCYRFKSREVDELEAATQELQQLCLKAGQFIIDNDRFDDFHIPAAARPLIRDAWEKEPPSIYGRFDLMYKRRVSAEAAGIQREHPDIPARSFGDPVIGKDQFNSIHEKLIAQWSEIKPYLKPNRLFFTSMDDGEDWTTITYLRHTAEQAGIHTSALVINQIGWNERAHEFRDLKEGRIDNIFSLYPWEWLIKDLPGPLLDLCPTMIWIEPIWKMMWSNKALLAVLWEMFPGHPNLLEAHLDGPGSMTEFVKKPLLSREGANITLHTRAGESSTTGSYGAEDYIYQALAPEASFDGMRPVLGSWYVTDQGPAGIGIRESDQPVTDNLSRFVPHFFD